ncbi:MAG: hypothetical protein EXR83_06585 [Gammaproteobacteria bacterium]|nr:hypothetical protein [Gammaproteobacteria bacterium]
MFQSNELIYMALQKTGSTHISGVLAQLFQGVWHGKLTGATAEQIRTTPFFLSSIRNPWEWYLSLWTYGVGGEGGLRKRLTQRNLLRAVGAPVNASGAWRRGRSRLLSLRDELSKDIPAWRAGYVSSDNQAAFRTWLGMILDPRNARALGEGYGDSLSAPWYGFMTHRYCLLCCQGLQRLSTPSTIASYADLVRFEQDNCYIHQFVRQEALPETLSAALEHVRALTPAERALILGAQRTNKSVRALSITDYYTADLIDLVARRDRLIVEKFGYNPPTLG